MVEQRMSSTKHILTRLSFEHELRTSVSAVCEFPVKIQGNCTIPILTEYL